MPQTNFGSQLDRRVLGHFKFTGEILPDVRPEDIKELLDAIPATEQNTELRRRLAAMLP